MLHARRFFAGIIRRDNNGIVTDFIKLRFKAEGAVRCGVSDIQIRIGRKHLDHGAGQRGRAYGHSRGIIRASACDIGSKVERNILLFAEQRDGSGIFTAILATHNDVEIIFANGLHGRVIAYLSALGIDQVAIVLAVDGDGAALPDIENNVVHRGTYHLVGLVRCAQLDRRQRNVNFIADGVQRLLLARVADNEGRQRNGHGFLKIVLIIVIPDVVEDIKRRYTASDNSGRAQFPDGDALPVRSRNGNGMRGQVIADGGDDDGDRLLVLSTRVDHRNDKRIDEPTRQRKTANDDKRVQKAPCAMAARLVRRGGVAHAKRVFILIRV